MDIAEFLTPVPFDLRWESPNPNGFFIGDYIQYEILEPQKDGIVLITMADSTAEEDIFFTSFRKKFYQLTRSNWKFPIYDLGSVLPGNTFEDTCFALHSINKAVLDKKMNLICLGGVQALSYVLFSSFKKNFINVGTIDLKLDISGKETKLTSDNFVTKMIMDANQKLLNYVNIGSQAPYNASEEFDILEQLNFENIRLGKAVSDLRIVEPYIRELDLLSVDMSSVQSSSFRGSTFSTINGFNQREICGLMRYMGLSDSVKNVHISNFFFDVKDSCLLAEMLWYFIDAKNNRKDDQKQETYRVQFEDKEIVFIKSINSERWWIEILVDGHLKRVPCHEQDYKDALKGEYPTQWLNFYKKFY